MFLIIKVTKIEVLSVVGTVRSPVLSNYLRRTYKAFVLITLAPMCFVLCRNSLLMSVQFS